MRTFLLSSLALVTMSLGAAADQPVPVEESSPCTTTEGEMLSASRERVLQCWSAWKQKWPTDEAGQKLRDQLLDKLFLEQPALSAIATFFVESLKLSADGGVANMTGRNGGPGQDSNTPARFDHTEWVYSLKLGWKDKPILKDFYLLTGNEASLDKYRAMARRKSAWRWALLDAVTVNASYSFGSTITDPDGDDNFTTKAKGGYEVKAAYTLPIESLLEGSHFAAPLRD
ncbi:MAG: hypothetical protein WEF50_18855 [Myxococcota bacterium]